MPARTDARGQAQACPATAGAARASFSCEAELLGAARRLGGATLAEIAHTLAIALPASPPRDKGFIGRTVERALGISPPSAATTDFAELGIELKTLPVARDGRPRESTFVCYVPIGSLLETRWAKSRVARKLARVLFVPIESEPGLPFGRRRIGRAFLWSPSAAQRQVLEADYLTLAARVAEGHLERLDARIGQVLQLRPKAANGRVCVKASDGDGVPLLTRPRGFYLRASFTAVLLRDSLSPICHEA